MALIGKIRKNSWILVVMVALGVGGFILMDIITANNGPGPSTSQSALGKINGKKIDQQQFETTWDMLYGNSGGDAFATREALWQYFVDEAIVSQQAEKMGLGVSRTELLDLEFGPNPSPIIAQRFSNPNAPGQVNREQLNSIKSMIEENRIQESIDAGQIAPTFIPYWKHQEKEIIQNRLESKLNSLVSKSLYTPTWMAEMAVQDENETAAFTYVKVPFDVLPNTEVSLSDSDYEAYLKENAAKYSREQETRRVTYVAFDVLPSAQDSATILAGIDSLVAGFQSATNDSAFVLRYGGAIDAAFVKKSVLSPALADTIGSLAVGSVYGPYLDGGAYNVVKVLDKKLLPDSVRSRHILRQAQNPTELAQAYKTIDSLKMLIETGKARFDSLAAVFGTDATRDKGGDLGYAQEGRMVKEFNDLIFYQAEQGELKVVETQFGVHLVEVTGKKFINNEMGFKVAYLREEIVPSEETQSSIYSRAEEFAAKNRKLSQLEEAAKKDKSVKLETSAPLERNAYVVDQALGATGEGRDIVRWAYSADKGDVSSAVYSFRDPVAYYDNKYVVAGLKDIQKAGLPSVESAKADIEQLVINRKKAEILAERVKGKDIQSIASSYQGTIDTVVNANFGQNFIENLGNEPAVLGTVFTLAEGKSSAPIKGETGVFVVNVIKKTAAPTDAAAVVPQYKQRLTGTYRAQLANGLVAALKKNAKIKDNRHKFY